MELINILDANAKATNHSPALDSMAKILYTPQDGNNSEMFRVDKVEFVEIRNHEALCSFYFKGISANTWEVTLTDSCVTFWNPFVPSFFGRKPSQKNGKASAGHMPYGSIFAVGFGKSPQGEYIMSVYGSKRRFTGIGICNPNECHKCDNICAVET